jgi:uncharacterized protein
VLHLLLALALVVAQPASQPSLPGAWTGTIDIPAANFKLEITVTFQQKDDGLAGTIDIPQQGAKAVPLRAITLKESAVRFELAPPAAPVAVFDGILKGERIEGTFTQGPGTGTFTLTRGAAAPETKAEPPPYLVEPLDVMNGDIKLAGTLTRPKEGSAAPAVVLVTGSGPQDRDETVFGFKVFATLADALTKKGIAVYRYDDRGVGESTGSLATATTEDFAGDALAAVAKLRTIDGIDPKRVGILGHSEGAVVAAIAATKSPDVAFIVMLAGTAVAGNEVLLQQTRDMSVAQGSTPEQVERVLAAHRAATDAVIRKADPEERTRLIRALVEAQIDALPPEQRAAIGDRDAFVEKRSRGRAPRWRSRGWRSCSRSIRRRPCGRSPCLSMPPSVSATCRCPPACTKRPCERRSGRTRERPSRCMPAPTTSSSRRRAGCLWNTACSRRRSCPACWTMSAVDSEDDEIRGRASPAPTGGGKPRPYGVSTAFRHSSSLALNVA